MVVAAIPISGAVGDQNNNAIGENPADGLSIGVTNSEIQETQDVLQKN
ncbi:MAG: peptidoglycan-binding protein, partial [Methanobacteriales archaeon HGW-Methanobacteriales-2]